MSVRRLFREATDSAIGAIYGALFQYVTRILFTVTAEVAR